MKISVFGLAVVALWLGATGAIAADPSTAASQSGVSSSPGVVGGRVPAETPPSTGLLPGSPGPYPSEGVTSPSTGAGSSALPSSPSSGSAAPSSGGNPG
jgi:hypothetical protein